MGTTHTAADLNPGDTIASEGMTLRVAQVAYRGEARPVEAIATTDGRYVELCWHEGPEADWVYFERYDRLGRATHGWCDSVSRRVLQVG